MNPAIKAQISAILPDKGFTRNYGMGLSDRHTAEQVYPELIEAITKTCKSSC